ncbi:hypothetical protein SEA_ARAXXI_18 [Microbacterium phage Araxxi]|uniref:Uncharacterized protein n=1 Tax=Microbacterium phage Araxxi TaxID=2590948 RepID=A0A516KT18_9CAUD|nr:hypothetical protein HWC57_gp18 [Microbacterium phage Araxxi]QDP44837.1 hypothetical protein SEA_ARAXXI_18 [Microbacterium phage Araxxi]USH45465.1 hypothetical protein SEA_DOTI_18 [Microbacterium phage DoTi]
MARDDHRIQCPARTDATEKCRCTEIEDAELAAASRPTAAQQIRAARLNGDIEGKFWAY